MFLFIWFYIYCIALRAFDNIVIFFRIDLYSLQSYSLIL